MKVSVKEQRKKAGITQEKLAVMSGVSIGSVRRIEQNPGTGRGDTLKKIANALGCKIDDLI